MTPDRKPSGKHIRLYLVDGSPTGILTAEIMGWTGKVLSFPRGLLPEALKRPECSKTGLYFLTGIDDEQGPLLYIGESDDVARRLKEHDSDDGKTFFEQVTLIVSKDENLTKSHVRYLENRLLDIAKRNGLLPLKNGTIGTSVALPEAEQSDMEYLLEQLRILLPVLGLTFLQERPKRLKSLSVELQEVIQDTPEVTFELSYLNGKIKATAYELNGEFVLEQGSLVRNLNAEVYRNEFKHSQYFTERFKHLNPLCESLSDNPLVLRITENIPFKTPSGASNFVTGANYNGRKYWKVKGTEQTYADWREAQLDLIETPS
jgi:hypothetical protein